MSNNFNNDENPGASIITLLGIFLLVAIVVIASYKGYLYFAEDVFRWDQRSTYTVGLSLLLILYASLFVRLMQNKDSKTKEDLSEEELEISKKIESTKPVKVLGLSAVMLFLTGCILIKNKAVWHIPGAFGLSLVAASCVFLIVCDYMQYKITGKKFYLLLIPIWIIVFFSFLSRILGGSSAAL